MNRKLRCIIVDDEPGGIKLLEAHLSKINYLESAGSFDDAATALAYLQEQDIDILFTDIQMPGMNGLDMVRSLPDPPVTIFVSAHRDFAPEGFETDAIDYLIKPVTFERFEKAVNKARDFIHLQSEAKKNTSLGNNFLFIRSEDGFLKIFFEEILYFQADGDYVSIVTAKDKEILWRITMSELENKLKGHQFIRVHKSYIVNVNSISSLKQGNIELINATKIPISKSYKEELNKRIGIS